VRDARVVDIVRAIGVAGDKSFGGREEHVVAAFAVVEKVRTDRALAGGDQVDNAVLPLVHVAPLRGEFRELSPHLFER
jgi:hypothetical protein